MREIKFRVWDKERKQMIYPDTKSEEWDYFELTLKGEICLYDSDDGQKNGLWEHTVTYNEGRFVLMQFTGLKDKNGEEIYEGDILGRNEGEFIRQIKWNNELCLFQAPFRDGSGLQLFTQKSLGIFEIIGNIHQNPKLLEIGR